MSAVDFGRRMVLPISAAVHAPRFSPSRDWGRAAVVRETADLFELDRPVPQAPPEPNVDASESIVMAGNVIENRMVTGAHVVRQRRTVDFAQPAELAIVEPFERQPTLQDDAAAALALINARRPVARPIALPAPSPWPYVVAAGVMVAMLVTAWLALRS